MGFGKELKIVVAYTLTVHHQLCGLPWGTWVVARPLGASVHQGISIHDVDRMPLGKVKIDANKRQVKIKQ